MGFICFLLVLNNLYLPLLMVKGNWERRIELANERRAKAKERKENKGKAITPENVMRRILLIAESEKATHRNYLSPSSDQDDIEKVLDNYPNIVPSSRISSSLSSSSLLCPKRKSNKEE